MKRQLMVALLALTASACVLSHVRMEIAPPGGCDQCHRVKIAGDWVLKASPVLLGKDGGVTEARDIALREVQALPYHQQVPLKKLAVYAAAAPAESSGGMESGVQCFACHESPGPPHEKARGYHPWGPAGRSR